MTVARYSEWPALWRHLLTVATSLATLAGGLTALTLLADWQPFALKSWALTRESIVITGFKEQFTSVAKELQDAKEERGELKGLIFEDRIRSLGFELTALNQWLISVEHDLIDQPGNQNLLSQKRSLGDQIDDKKRQIREAICEQDNLTRAVKRQC